MNAPRRSSWLVLLVAAAALASGCARAAAPASPAAAGQPAAPGAPSPAIGQGPSTSTNSWLVVGRPGQRDPEVIDAATGERFMQLPLGVPDGKWGRFVEAVIVGKETSVQRLDVSQGPDGKGVTLPGIWRLPTVGSDPTPVGLSGNESTVVLVEADTSASAARGISRFAVVDLAAGRLRRMIELHGSFEYDAISPDGSNLYVVEHLDAVKGGHYQVRLVETLTGRMAEGIIVDKRNIDERMAGWAIEQLRLANGFALTVYRGAEHPFIHALDTVQGGAFCIDLPAPGQADADAASDWGLARSPDGATIYAVNATVGVAADVDPVDLVVRRTSTIPPGTASIVLAKFGHEDAGVTGRRVIVSPDGARIFAASRSGVVELSAKTLEVTRRLLPGTRVDALGLTRDGGGLFALRHSGGNVVRLDVASGNVVAEVPAGGFDRLLAVVPIPQE